MVWLQPCLLLPSSKLGCSLWGLNSALWGVCGACHLAQCCCGLMPSTLRGISLVTQDSFCRDSLGIGKKDEQPNSFHMCLLGTPGASSAEPTEGWGPVAPSTMPRWAWEVGYASERVQ